MWIEFSSHAGEAIELRIEVAQVGGRQRVKFAPVRASSTPPHDRFDRVEQPSDVVAHSRMDGDRDSLTSMEGAEPGFIGCGSPSLDREIDISQAVDGVHDFGECIEPLVDRNVIFHLVENSVAFVRQ